MSVGGFVSFFCFLFCDLFLIVCVFFVFCFVVYVFCFVCLFVCLLLLLGFFLRVSGSDRAGFFVITKVFV